MTQEPIEAVRRDISALRNGLLYPWQHDAAKDRILATIDHLTKANEELRAEVERLQTTIKAFNNGMPAMTTKEVADENADLRATIDRLTKERDEARKVIEDMRATAVYRRAMVAEARTRLSARQEAIDEAVQRADTETPFKTHVIVSDVVEPLRPFATKPEVDPLVGEVTVSILNRGERVVSLLELARLIDGGARITALAARGGRVVFDGREG